MFNSNILKDSSGNSFPSQKKTYFQKTEDWKRKCVDGVIQQCNTFQNKRRSSFKNKRRNYDLMNNKIIKSDFDYVTNPLGIGLSDLKNFEMPATLQPYDVLSPIFNVLLGEGTKRYFSPVVRAINADSINMREVTKNNELLMMLRDYLISEEADEQYLEAQLKKFNSYTPADIRESQAQHLITMLQKYEKTDITFENGFFNSLVVGEEIYDIKDVAGRVKLRCVNPLEINYILSVNSDNIDDAEKIYEKNFMSVSEIIDEFYEVLTPAQIDDLEKHGAGDTTFYNYDFNNVPVQDYFPDGSMFLGDNIPVINSIDDLHDSEFGIAVHRVRWKSKRKIGILHYIDENNEEQEMYIDEVFKVPKNNPDIYVEYMWINEMWEGVRIGNDLYLNIQPRKNQFRELTNLSECKTGYVGHLYSAKNSRSVSLMDRLVPWLYLYLIIWYRVELLLATNIGRIALVDISLIPDGWELEKWLYYASSMKIGFVNSFNESMKQRGGNMNQSTQNKSLDLNTGSEIQFYVSLLEFIEKKIEDTSGVPRQRKGEITSSERVGNTERVISTSSNITEPWFKIHDDVKLRCIEAMLKVCQDVISERGDKAFLYVTDDMSTVYGTISKSEFPSADFKCFISNSSKDLAILDTFKQYMSEALQNDKLDFSMIADIIGNESIADIKSKLKEAEAIKAERDQKNFEAQQNNAKEINDANIQFEVEKLDREDINKELDRQKDIYVAELKALGTSGINNNDINDNLIPDVTEIANTRLKELDILQKSKDRDQKNKEHQDKMSFERDKLKQERILKEKEIKAKLIDSQNKVKIAKTNKNKYDKSKKK